MQINLEDESYVFEDTCDFCDTYYKFRNDDMDLIRLLVRTAHTIVHLVQTILSAAGVNK